MPVTEMHPIWPRIDEVEKRAIPYLEDWDTCYYFLNRINGGYSASRANQRIANFKHSIEKHGNNPWPMHYKNREIERFAEDLYWHLMYVYGDAAAALDIALVPMNTSRPDGDAFFDDRLVRLCELASTKTGGIIRAANVMHSRTRITESHYGGTRDIEALRANLLFDGFGDKVPTVAILVDDVLTTGAHYAACRDAILKRYGCEGEIYVEGAFLCLHRSNFVNYPSYGIVPDW